MSFLAQAYSKACARNVSPRARHSLDFVWHGGNESFEKVCRDGPGGFFVQLGEGELRGAVDGHEEVELAFFGSHLGNIDVEIADGVSLSGSRLMPWRW